MFARHSHSCELRLLVQVACSETQCRYMYRLNNGEEVHPTGKRLVRGGCEFTVTNMTTGPASIEVCHWRDDLSAFVSRVMLVLGSCVADDLLTHTL